MAFPTYPNIHKKWDIFQNTLVNWIKRVDEYWDGDIFPVNFPQISSTSRVYSLHAAPPGSQCSNFLFNLLFELFHSHCILLPASFHPCVWSRQPNTGLYTRAWKVLFTYFSTSPQRNFIKSLTKDLFGCCKTKNSSVYWDSKSLRNYTAEKQLKN